MKNSSHLFSTHKNWLLAFILVMSIHTAVIAAMVVNKEKTLEVSAAPSSAVIMVYAQVNAQSLQKVTESPIVKKILKSEPEIIIETQAKNGTHQQIEKTRTYDNEPTIDDIAELPIEEKTIEPMHKNEVKRAETQKEELINEEEIVKSDEALELNINADSQQSVNQQVSLHSEHQTDRGAMAKNQNELAMAQWQHKVQAHLESLKRYPPLALKQKRQGIVTVYFTINKKGEILSSALLKASGIGMLDRATVQLIARANPLPKPPEHIFSQQLSIEVPIRYFIR